MPLTPSKGETAMSCMQKNKIVLLTAILTLVLSTSAFGDSLTITASASPKAGGSISPSGRVGVGYGENLQFTITPNTGYQIKDVTVDRVSQGAVNIYTFTNITQRHSIKATFTKQTFTVTIAQGGNVSVSPVGTKTATYGQKIKLKVRPNSEDVVPILLVNAQQVDATKSGNVYEFVLTVSGDTSVYATSAVEPLLSTNTKGVDASTVQNLASVSQDQSVLTFKQNTTYLQSLQAGDVIVMGVTDLTPYGLLRKVSNVSVGGSEITVETTRATLEDVFEEAEIIINQPLTASDIESFVPLVEGVSLPRNKIEDSAQLSLCPVLNNVLFYDFDGNLSTTDDQIVLNGKVCLDPMLKLALSMKKFKIQKFIFSVGISESISLELDARFSLSFTKEIEIYRHEFKKITLWFTVPFPPFVIPVVFFPVLTVNVGIDGKVSAGITTSVTQQAGFEVGVSYLRGKGWVPIKNSWANFDYVLPTLSTQANARVYAGPEFDLLLYGVIGPYADVEGYLDLQMEPLSDPWLKLIGGLQTGAGIVAEILGYTLFDYEIKPIFEIHKTLAEVAGNKPPRITSLTANSATLFTGNTSTVKVGVSDPENDPVTCSWSASGGTLSPTTGCGSVTWTAPGTPGNYGVSVGVSDNKAGHVPITGAVSISVLPLPVSAATLTVNKAGSGNGTVTGTGIDCGSDCSEDYANGTSVTLTATPFIGATLTSWSGCDSTSGNTCTVIMNQSRTVTATFSMVLPP